MKKTDPMRRRGPFEFDIDNLLHPSRAFQDPQHVVNDPDLTLNEKRAILASWASDACAIEAAPELRQAPGTAQPVRFDDVMDALRALEVGFHRRWRDVGQAEVACADQADRDVGPPAQLAQRSAD